MRLDGYRARQSLVGLSGHCANSYIPHVQHIIQYICTYDPCKLCVHVHTLAPCYLLFTEVITITNVACLKTVKAICFQHPPGAEQQKSGWAEAAEAQMLKPHKC